MSRPSTNVSITDEDDYREEDEWGYKLGAYIYDRTLGAMRERERGGGESNRPKSLRTLKKKRSRSPSLSLETRKALTVNQTQALESFVLHSNLLELVEVSLSNLLPVVNNADN